MRYMYFCLAILLGDWRVALAFVNFWILILILASAGNLGSLPLSLLDLMSSRVGIWCRNSMSSCSEIFVSSIFLIRGQADVCFPIAAYSIGARAGKLVWKGPWITFQVILALKLDDKSFVSESLHRRGC